MKTAIYFCSLCLATILAAPSKNQITDPEEALKALSKLYDIGVDTRPEDGTVTGIRIRRNHQSNGGQLAKNEEFVFPELDIQKINDQTLSVNGIRLKRSDLNSLSDVDIEKDIAAEASDIDARTRRSGSGVESLLGALISKITSKFASLSGASSGGGGEEHDTYGPPPVQTYDDKSFDIWSFKKAILSHLLQAVKAIKGGVIAIGGQLIKAKGHLISTAGKVVAKKGDAISGFGRHIASSALAPPTHATHHAATAFAQAAVDHIPDTGYPASGYPESSYGVPSIPNSYSPPSSNYGPPQHGYNKRGASSNQFGVPSDLPNGVQAGLLVLKPINSEHPSSPYINPRGVQSFGSRDSFSAHSELQSVIANSPTAQSRNYYIRY